MGCLDSVSFCPHRKTFTRREVGEPSLFQFLFICHHLATQITGVIVLWVEQTLNGVESFNLISETKLDDSIQCLKNEFMLGFLNARATGAPTVVKIMDRNSWKSWNISAHNKSNRCSHAASQPQNIRALCSLTSRTFHVERGLQMPA